LSTLGLINAFLEYPGGSLFDVPQAYDLSRVLSHSLIAKYFNMHRHGQHGLRATNKTEGQCHIVGFEIDS